jgi:putative sigma-54 modulation protein
MQIRTTARHFDLTEDLKSFAEKQIGRLGRYFDNIIDSHLILDMEKSRMSAELKVKVYGTVLSSKHRSFDMYDSVEKVIDKMETQIKKYKAKLRDKKAKKTSAIKEQMNIQEEEGKLKEWS